MRIFVRFLNRISTAEHPLRCSNGMKSYKINSQSDQMQASATTARCAKSIRHPILYFITSKYNILIKDENEKNEKKDKRLRPLTAETSTIT